MLTREEIEDIAENAREAFDNGMGEEGCPYSQADVRWSTWMRSFHTAAFGASMARKNLLT